MKMEVAAAVFFRLLLIPLAVFLLASSMMLSWMGAAGGGGYDDDDDDDDDDGGYDDDDDDDYGHHHHEGEDEERDDDDDDGSERSTTTFEEGDDDDEEEMINVIVWEEGQVESGHCWIRRREVAGPTRENFMYRLHLQWHEEGPGERPILPWPVYLDHPWPGYSLEFLTADDTTVLPELDYDWRERGPLIRKVNITKLDPGEEEESDADDESDEGDEDDDEEMINVIVWEDGDNEDSDRSYTLQSRKVMGPTRNKLMYRLHLLWHGEDPYERPILPWPVYVDHPWPGYYLEFWTADDVSVSPDRHDDWTFWGPLIRKVHITKHNRP